MSDENEALRRVMDGTPWSEFCDSLRAAGAIIRGAPAPVAPLDRSEGWRYLSRTSASERSGATTGPPAVWIRPATSRPGT